MQATLNLEFQEFTADQVRNASSYKKAREMIIANFNSKRIGRLWLIRGLLAIYARQTSDEQNTEQTIIHNGIGFSAFDAQLMTGYAQQVERFNKGESKFGQPLSDRQFDLLKMKMTKYAMQLAKIARPKQVEDVQDNVDHD